MKEQAKFTPGPWSIETDEGGLWISAISPYDVTRKCCVGALPGSAVYADNKANMTLCASAPELLEALEGLLAATHWEECDNLLDSHIIAIESARAAIVKATCH